MKRKILALMMIAIMLTGSVAFAASTPDVPNNLATATSTTTLTTPTDVVDTNYQTAVDNLIKKGIVSGYEDGTFKPLNKVKRAEACKFLVLMTGESTDVTNSAVNTTDSAIKADTPFIDTQGHWAEEYINTAYKLGYIKGMETTKEGQIFAPNKYVKVQDLLVMTIRALGKETANMAYPDGYISEASELGLLKDVDAFFNGKPHNWTMEATRGMTALIINHGVGVYEANKVATDTGKTPVTPPVVNNGKLSDFSGSATGMILGTAKIIGAKGDQVDEIEFLMGSGTYNLPTNGSSSISNALNTIQFDGAPYVLTMNDGVVTRVRPYTNGIFKNSTELTIGFDTVTSAGIVNNQLITLTKTIQVKNEVIVYKLTGSGSKVTYERATKSNIKKSVDIRVYDLTDDGSTMADVIVIDAR